MLCVSWKSSELEYSNSPAFPRETVQTPGAGYNCVHVCQMCMRAVSGDGPQSTPIKKQHTLLSVDQVSIRLAPTRPKREKIDTHHVFEPKRRRLWPSGLTLPHTQGRQPPYLRADELPYTHGGRAYFFFPVLGLAKSRLK